METYRTHRWQSAEEMYDAFSKTHDSIIYNNNAEKYLAPFNKINSKEGILSPEKIYKLQEIVEGVKNEPYRSEKVLDEIIHLYDEREIKDSKAILEQCNSFEKEESSHLTKKINEIHKKYDNFTNIARAYARQPPIDAA